MPSAVRVEQLAEGTLIKDNSSTIEEILGEHNVVNGLASCGCESATTNTQTAGSLALLGLIGLVTLRRRRR